VGHHNVLVGGKRLFDAENVQWERAAAVLERHTRAGASSLMVAIDGELQAVLGYADQPRPESKAIVRALRAGGRRKIVLLSGDARGVVHAVGDEVGVDQAVGELLPEDKAAFVRSLQKAGKTVAMVGDGINDAPALALADIGVSLHGGTDVALESADVVLLDGGLAKLPYAFYTADRAMRHVRRGVGLVIVPNAVAIVLGALGLLAPAGAAAVNNGSTVIAALCALAPLVARHGNAR
jgi:Cu2+-exporting ATPase